MQLNTSDNMPILFLVMAWRRQVANHHRCQCWLRFVSSFDCGYPWVGLVLTISLQFTSNAVGQWCGCIYAGDVALEHIWLVCHENIPYTKKYLYRTTNKQMKCVASPMGCIVYKWMQSTWVGTSMASVEMYSEGSKTKINNHRAHFSLADASWSLRIQMVICNNVMEFDNISKNIGEKTKSHSTL